MRHRSKLVAWEWTDDRWSPLFKTGRRGGLRDEEAFFALSVRAQLPPDLWSFTSPGLPAGMTFTCPPRKTDGSQTGRDDGIEIGLVHMADKATKGGSTPSRPNRTAGLFVAIDQNPAGEDRNGETELYFLIRREIVEGRLGSRIPTRDFIAQLLPRSRIASVLREQIVLLFKMFDTLGTAEHQFLCNQLARLALFALEQSRVLSASQTPMPARKRDDTFERASALIATHYPREDLDATCIAKQIGVSRATLYRAFADRNETVAGVIRKVRLASSADLLRAGPPFHGIEAIAEACGFAHARSFQRAFRAHFGKNPSEFREPIDR